MSGSPRRRQQQQQQQQEQQQQNALPTWMLVGGTVGAFTSLVGFNVVYDDSDPLGVTLGSLTFFMLGGLYGALLPVTLPATALVLIVRSVRSNKHAGGKNSAEPRRCHEPHR